MSLDGGVKEAFKDSENEAEYVDLKVGPVLFQDDIGRLSENIKSAQEGNNKIEDMAEKKLLDFNLDKSCVIIIGSRKFRRNKKEELETNPLTFCDEIMKVVESERYLGDFIGPSLSESVFITVKKRKVMVQRLISEIKVTIEDCRSSVVGGISAGLQIWNMAVMPFLYNNSECWTDMPKKLLVFLVLFKILSSVPYLEHQEAVLSPHITGTLEV